jgi:hypothetical protein
MVVQTHPEEMELLFFYFIFDLYTWKWCPIYQLFIHVWTRSKPTQPNYIYIYILLYPIVHARV